MRQALLVVDVQRCFSSPSWLVDNIITLLPHLPSAATVKRHDEAVVPFWRQLGWAPAPDDECLVSVNRVFVKHGYIPTPDTLDYLRSLAVDRVLVCGLQAETWYSQLDSRSLMPVFSQR